MNNLEDDCSSTCVPSILIDKNILTSTLTPRQNEDVLKMVNETENLNEYTYSTVIPGRNENEYNIFEETEQIEEYAEFELYVERRSNIKQNFFVGNLSDEEQYCWTPDSSADDEPSIDEETPLYIFIQELPNGIIINSNVYLTTHQWNTIIIGDFIVCCIFCDFYLTKNDIYKHINSEEHKVLLETVKPLAKYDLSIVRKIREKYHCGVCNETFDIKDASDHTDLKSHEENLLFAINKVSDVIEYCEAENNDSNSSYESCDNSVRDNENVINDDVINNDNFINDGINYHVGDEDEDYISEWVITANNNPELSYANKLKLNSAPKDYVIELKNKRLKVSFNCWHMIAITRKNELYCMACKIFHPLNLKFQHCESAIHSENLKKCEVDNRFGNYFIRKVEHLYHCGHCNAIYPSIEDHLELKHALKMKRSENLIVSSQSIAEVKKVQKPNDTHKVINDKVNNNSVNINDQVNNSVKVNDNKSININDNAIASTSNNFRGPDMFQNIVLNFFTHKISLPILNYNAIIKQYFNVGKFNHFCALCNVNFRNGESVIPHTNTVYHIQMMQKTPFIAQFDCNMLRNINGMLHCALCNEFINPIFIPFHIQHPRHLHNLRTSVFINATPLINVNTNNDKPNPTLNTNNDDERKENQVLLKVNDDETKTNEVTSELNEEDETTENETNEEMNDTLNDTLESIIDLNAYVFVKLNSLHLKVTFTSYNTLVPKGDGNRYCFVCSSHVKDDEIKHHAESRSHVKNIDDCHFIDTFEGVPLRQMYLIYHCGICNALIKRSNLKDHLDWPTHITLYENARNLSKKQRKVELKDGTPRITAKINREVIYNHALEPESKILYAVLIVDKVEVEIKMYKMIILDAIVLKVSIDSWNGISHTKDCIRCIICQKEIDDKDTHVKTEEHTLRVQYPFIKQSVGELLREINKNSYHCIVCNVEVSNFDDVVTKHVEGKKHKKNFETIKNFSSQTSSYDDCVEDVLQL